MSVSTEVDTASGKRRDDSTALRYLSRTFDVVLGFIFLLAALSHLANPYFFLSTIYDYQIVGPELGKWVAATLPHMELAVALCLLAGLWRQSAAMMAGFLMLGFVAVQSIGWLRGLDISCGCFAATGTESISSATVGRDAVICIFAWATFGLSRQTT